MNQERNTGTSGRVHSTPLKCHDLGGKHYLAGRLIALMPPHLHYVEPYFGGGSVLLAKPHEGVSEVANDVAGELVNFWRHLADPNSFPSLQRRLEATPFAQAEFVERLQKPSSPEALDALGSGGAVLYPCPPIPPRARPVLRNPFAEPHPRRHERTSVVLADGHRRIAGDPHPIETGGHSLRRRLEGDSRQDGPNTFFYCDPPYLHENPQHDQGIRRARNERRPACGLALVLVERQGPFHAFRVSQRHVRPHGGRRTLAAGGFPD